MLRIESVFDNKRAAGFFCVLIVFFISGCASDEAADLRRLTRQQSATMESLQSEILRLNRELDETVDSRSLLDAAKPEMENAFAEEVSKGNVRIASDSRGLIITIFDHALFDPEETRLLPSGEEILGKLAGFFSGNLSQNLILIEGHTDSQPVEGSGEVTNWEYSIGRATAVLHYLLDSQKMIPERFEISGYGEYRPIASNDTEEGRVQNRRVEIVMTPSRLGNEKN